MGSYLTLPLEVMLAGGTSLSACVGTGHDPEEHNIRMMIMENSHKIKFLHESLHVNVGEVKRIVKHCEMMNNQVE